MTGEILVVGTGVVGLTMAVELAHRGVDVRIIGQLPAHPAADILALEPTTLEIFARLGISDQLTSRGVRADGVNVFRDGKPVAHLRIDRPTPHPYILIVRRRELEEMLETRLTSLGVIVERDVELVELTQWADEVDTELRHKDLHVEQTTARWVVGCDGASSIVRHEIGLPLAGPAPDEEITIAEVRIAGDVPPDALHWAHGHDRFVGCSPTPDGRHQLALVHRPKQASGGAVIFTELQKALDQFAFPSAAVAEIINAKRFPNLRRVAGRQAPGRVFLAGDAAQVHSAFTGFGENNGVHDAYALGRKLSAATSGQVRGGVLGVIGRTSPGTSRRPGRRHGGAAR
ncbi:FAD-dependent monooxygenase [Mycolicibacterium mageritense]|uniref:FAD-dependent monooxygenase n=1 Tax=Mycolicibacterium mageritense TaxID=53462 RepID=UPI0011DBF1AC|nr:FAD-dependent monooxygenase [Mycolicibacterium mageritense]TXI63598.1 MAG: hypothetical protein E6Q55_08995 [Mycolicibacterium mageritense]